MLVTTAALLALGVVIAVGPDGPARLWLDGGGSTVSLEPRTDGSSGAEALPGGPVGLLPGASTTSLSGVTLGSPITATDRPGTVQLRSNTRVERRAARTPAANRPNRPAPAATSSPLQSSSQSSATTPVASSTPAPGSTVVKSRGRGTSPSKSEVPKQRVQTAKPAPSAAPPPSSTPGPVGEPRGASAPATELRPARQGGQPPAGVGAADGVLRRVPPTHP